MKNAEHIIKILKLEKHPEGGYFRETYRSDEHIPLISLPDRFKKEHSFSTAIYFMLKRGEFSALHKIRSDEIWHFYSGASITVHIIDREGNYTTETIGTDLENGEMPQCVVPAGSIFGATIPEISDFDYSLVGCTVAPGFDFEDFHLFSREDLLKLFPQHSEIISKLTRE